MKHSMVVPPPGTTVTVRSVNGGGAGSGSGGVGLGGSGTTPTISNGGGGGGGAVTYVRLSPAATVTQLTSGGSFMNGGGSGGGGVGGGNQNQVVIRRLPNNKIQIRRIITQQPQQLHQIQMSSEESSVEEFQPKKNGGRGGKEEGICLEEDDDDMGEVAVAMVDRGEEEDDNDDEEDLLMDQDEGDDGDDGGEGGRDRRTVFEMNGEGVDPDYLRHVIETQILNRHKARIKDWDGTRRHMCQSCHEMFLSENGLESHRNRRIHHILFYCRYCKRDLSFFNKCRLLQHLRNHRVTPTVSGLQNCTMIRLLPESDYLHFKYEDCTSSSDEDNGDGGDKAGSGAGSGTGTGSSSSPASKRMKVKPSKFRRVPKSSLSGNGMDLDSPDEHSPPPTKTNPSVSRQIVAPPQPLSEAQPQASSSPVVLSVSGGNVVSVGGTIKYAGLVSSGNGGQNQKNQQQQQQRTDQVTVIKSTGNTTSVILSSPAKETSTGDPAPPVLTKQPSLSPSSESPQIRIRNLSQITVSINEEGEEESQEEEHDHQMEVDPEPMVQLRPQLVRSAPVQVQVKSEVTNSSPQSVISKEYRCYKCDKSYNSNRDFFQHLQEQEAAGLTSRSLHRCPTDDIPSWSQCQYVFHTKVFHEKSVPFMCPGCGEEMEDYNGLLEHVTNECFYLSLRVRYMCASGSGGGAAGLQKCSFGDKKSVKTEPEMIDHLKKEHSRAVLQCVHCTQGFATENWLVKHLGDAHKITLDESKGESERDALINKTTRPLTQCLICNILFPNGPTFLQHVYLNFHMHILHAKMLECQTCFAVFETTQDLMNHRKHSDHCRKLDPFLMKISEHGGGGGGGNGSAGGSSGMTPTTIKIIANPAAAVISSGSGSSSIPSRNQSDQKQNSSSLNPARSQGATVAVISSTSNSNGKPPALIFSQQQRSQKAPPPRQANMANSSQPPNSGRPVPPPPGNRKINKTSFFDDLQSCQFCERLVVFSSLRKHEDQCCGLSTVAPGFCLTCRKNFGDKKTLARHGIVHIQEGLPICLFCNNRHIRPTHPKSLTPSSHENLYALKKHLYSNHTSKAVHFPFQCPLCNKMCNDKRSTEFHIKDHQFKYNANDPDPAPLPTSTEDIQRLVKVRRKGNDTRKRVGNANGNSNSNSAKIIHVYYSPVCKNREFAMENGLARHLKLVHQKNPRSLNLSLLKKVSTARRFVLKGPQSQGATSSNSTGQRPQLRSVSLSNEGRRAGVSNTTTRTGGNSQVTVSSSSSATTSFTSRFSSGVVLRKRIVAATSIVNGRKPASANANASAIPQKNVPATRLRSSTDSRPPSNFLQTRSSASSSSSPTKSTGARKKDGNFTCLKCPDFSCKSENAFCEHIKWKHVWSEVELQKLQYGNKAGMEEPTEYWCPECNTVLVAKPSLVRHLKSAHDYIENVEEYMQKIGYEGKKPLKPNQCEVCYFQCGDDRELQQHIRTHGMAFLRLRQQRQLSVTKS